MLTPMLVPCYSRRRVVLVVEMPKALCVSEEAIRIIHEVSRRAEVHSRPVHASVIARDGLGGRDTRREVSGGLSKCIAGKQQHGPYRVEKHLLRCCEGSLVAGDM